MRRGRIFKRCSKCGRPAGSQLHSARCSHAKFSWAYQVDLAASGAPRRQKIKGGFATKAEAVDALSELQAALKSSNYVEPSKLTLGEYLNRWLPAVKGDVRPSTHSAYEMHVRLYLQRLGNVPLQNLTRPDVRGLYQRLQQEGGERGPLSNKSIHNIHLTLHKALADGVSDRLLQHNVADGAHKLSNDRREMTAWAPAEIRAFLEHVAGDRLFALWRLAVTTGMRRGELLGLRWSDVDLEAAQLAVSQTRIKGAQGAEYGRPKTAKGRRSLALDESTVGVLRTHRTRQHTERLAWGPGWSEVGLVFTRESGFPLDPDTVSQAFERHAQKAGLPRIRFHDLRHSYATAALKAGVPTKVVSERLGHASVGITLDVYSHVLPGMDRGAAQQIAALLDA